MIILITVFITAAIRKPKSKSITTLKEITSEAENPDVGIASGVGLVLFTSMVSDVFNFTSTVKSKSMTL
jgi:hypothetical protein